MLLAVSILLLCTGISVSADLLCAQTPGKLKQIKADWQCTQTPGKLRQIDAGNGSVYGVNDDGNLYRWLDNDWKLLPGKYEHVSVGISGVVAVTKANLIYQLQDKRRDPIPGHLVQIDAGGKGFLAGVSSEELVYCVVKSCSFSSIIRPSLRPIEGAIKYYSCGPFGCWGVNDNNNIFLRHNVKPTACQGNQWEKVSGEMVMVEVGEDGSVFAVNGGKVYRRLGMSAQCPAGLSWSQLNISGTFKHVTYDNGYLWLINTIGEIFRCAEPK